MTSKKLANIHYSILSPKKVRELAVVKVVSPDLYDQDGFPVEGGIFDPRMGVIDPGLTCKTCGKNYKDCPGHFGYIELTRPVIHPFYAKKIYDILSSTCPKCGKVVLDDKKLKELKEKYKDLPLEKREEVLKEIWNLLRKVKKCPHCGAEKPVVAFEKPYYFYYIEEVEADEEEKKKGKKTKEIKHRLDPIRIRDWLENVRDEDLWFFAISEELRPEWFVLTNLLVPPPQVRPSIILETGERSEDDLTHKLVDIVRTNQKLLEYINAGTPEVVVNEIWDLLQYHVATYFDNELPGIFPAIHRSGRPLKTLIPRIKSKEGRLRYNLAGKRVNFSARSVISVDPMIKPWEVGVPEIVAKKLTVPERVTEWNIEYLKSFIKNGPDKWPGANYVITPDGKRKRILAENIEQILEEIEPGYVVERHLVDGDIVLFNRQPTLHKLSIMAHEVRVLPGKTFRLHPAVCPPYNADFDGDEMNLHVPQTEEARAEARELLHITKLMIHPKHGKVSIGATFDALSGTYLLQKLKLKKQEAYELLVESGANEEELKKFEELNKDKEEVEGIRVIEALIPKIDYEDEKIKIENGRIIEGEFHKKLIKEGDGHLLKAIHDKLGAEKAFEFLYKIFRLGIKTLNRYGLTLTLDDSNIDQKIREKMKEKIEESYKKVKELIEQKEKGKMKPLPGKTLDETLEVKILKELNKLREDIGLLVEENLNEESGTMIMSKSGAKGKIIDLVEIAGIVGQQSIEGKRVDFGYRERNLTHFKRKDLNPKAKGFIDRGLREGLDPISFFFAALTARDSLMDQALNTPESGYLYRRLSNALADTKVREKGIVFDDATEQVVQFRFGEDGLSVEKGGIDLDAIAREVKRGKRIKE
ncbi:MAG: DNA-directed RNA polymerase subunit A' [Nanoarchaeota archaeon]